MEVGIIKLSTARKQAELGTLTKMIREMHNEGTIVAGVCTGGMLLAASGILNDKGDNASFGAE